MEQGNPDKVNAIIEEILKNNSLFKLKPTEMQNKEKASIAKGINSALSVLNEEGKELVLQDLSVDPDEKFKGFIDSVGNIDISGLTKMTATIVKAKIEEAEREGLNLRTGEPVFKNDSKISVVEGVLTVALINEMVNNFKNLPYEQQKGLFDNWNLLTTSQKSKILETQANLLAEQSFNEIDTARKETLEQAAQNTDFYSKKIKDAEAYTEEQAKEKIENYLLANPNARELYNKYKANRFSEKDIYILFIDRDSKTMGEATADYFAGKMSEQDYNRLVNRIGQQITISTSLENEEMLTHFKLSKSDAKKIAQNNPEQILKLQDMYTFFTNFHKLPNIETVRNLTIEEQYELYQKNQRAHTQKKYSEQVNLTTEQPTSQEIEQLPIALAKANFSQEEIKTGLAKYIEFIKTIDNDALEKLSMLDSNLVSKTFYKKLSQKFGMNEQMASILSKINFSGKLFDVLSNEEQKKEFFDQFDKVINQEHIQNKHEPLTGELEQIFSQYFQDNAVDMNVSAIEAQQKHLTEEKQQDGQAQQPEEQKVDSSLSVAEIKLASEEHTQENATNPEQEISEEVEQITAITELDNSFIGKIRRVFANMKDMKNKDNSKGFFARLGASIKTVFGNKEEHYEEQDSSSTVPEVESQTQPTTGKEPIGYFNQHIEVNTNEAVQKTEESKQESSKEDDRDSR